MPSDSVNLQSLSIHLRQGLGPSAFNLDPPPPCPILLNISMILKDESIVNTAEGDSMSGLGVNYSSVSKDIYGLASCPGRKWNSSWELMEELSKFPLGIESDVKKVKIECILPKSLLHADSTIYKAIYSKSIKTDTNTKQEQGQSMLLQMENQQCEISNIKTECIIGLHPHERTEKQRLEIDVEVNDVNWDRWNHKEFADEVYDYVTASSYGTIESLIHALGAHLFQLPILSHSDEHAEQPSISITIRKPSAIPYAIPSITIHRTKVDYSTSTSTSSSTNDQGITGKTRVFIAVGSNIGDRIGHINKAIRELQENGCELANTSRLYESEPMYVEDQDRFINGAIELYTFLEPLELLRLLKRTEKSVGRTKTFTNGPRVIDLDLVFYGDELVKIGERGDEPDEDGVGWLECPHRSLGEREFVLRPLADIAPNFVHPSIRQTINQLLSKLPQTIPPPLQPIIPFSAPSKPLRLSTPSIPHVMAIFNATPDSFSDGDPARTDSAYAIKSIEELFEDDDYPDILDIGGMSTRPNSEPCSEEEEINRVIPLLKAIRQSTNLRLREIPISIDTYRSAVAKLAIEAGANCINDVRGGSEPGMLEVMSESNVPVILMHSRGDSKTMNSKELTDYSKYQGGVVKGVRIELEETIEKALKAGIKKWNIILDPGLGFAKSYNDNLLLLKNLPLLFEERQSKLKGYPMLVGGSRKGFIGKTINKENPKERSFGDSALNSWCTQIGLIDILRVHNHKETRDTIKMSVAIRDA
ncbi:dihydropteroate synthase [Kwoniella dendrophila CBS 6074]|uniref:Dihydropteroate synthase n=1 Tax=Kwoniella dendrophila CBS 6074 TaxID=1295534 RepID=A0AAX4JNU3_9TREE